MVQAAELYNLPHKGPFEPFRVPSTCDAAKSAQPPAVREQVSVEKWSDALSEVPVRDTGGVPSPWHIDGAVSVAAAIPHRV